jgi:superfamily II DNA/RNA helicase
VLVPTRELASQVQHVLWPLASAVGLKVATIFGGTPQRPQVTALHNRVDVIVACPGRLADLIGQGHCHLGDVEVSVVNEADHMADLGFLPTVRRLLDALGAARPPPSAPQRAAPAQAEALADDFAAAKPSNLVNQINKRWREGE